MAKIMTVHVCYGATRKPAGDYTSDHAEISWTIQIEEGEKASTDTSQCLDLLKKTVLERLK